MMMLEVKESDLPPPSELHGLLALPTDLSHQIYAYLELSAVFQTAATCRSLLLLSHSVGRISDCERALKTRHLARLVPRFPRAKWLHLGNCRKLEPDALALIARGLPDLRGLVLKGLHMRQGELAGRAALDAPRHPEELPGRGGVRPDGKARAGAAPPAEAARRERPATQLPRATRALEAARAGARRVEPRLGGGRAGRRRRRGGVVPQPGAARAGTRAV